MKAFFLAGGLGSRLGRFTIGLPKVMVPIKGYPVLAYLVQLCRIHGVKEIVISLHYFPEKVVDYFRDGRDFGVSINYSLEKEALGTAGAVANARHYLEGGPFLVFNADVLTDVDLTEMISFHRRQSSLVTVLAHVTDHPFDSDLVDFDKDFVLKRFFRPKPGEDFVSFDSAQDKPFAKTGTHIFEPGIFGFIPQGVSYSLEKQLIPSILEKGEKVAVFSSRAYSKDMGTEERLSQVNRDLEDGKIKVIPPARRSFV